MRSRWSCFFFQAGDGILDMGVTGFQTCALPILRLPIGIGTAVILMSLIVLLFWIPLRELPGLGTIANSFVVGLAADFTLSVLDAPDSIWARGLLMVGGVVLNALATALYIGSQFGPGPREIGRAHV